MNDVLTFIISRSNYIIYILLMMLGMYGIFAKKNYMKKIIGMNILQTAIILFFISISAKRGATIPILEIHNDHGTHATAQAINYINPLPHVLMLTAIVVAVATLGVALAMAIKIYTDFKTIEEDKILSELEKNAKNENG